MNTSEIVAEYNKLNNYTVRSHFETVVGDRSYSEPEEINAATSSGTSFLIHCNTGSDESIANTLAVDSFSRGNAHLELFISPLNAYNKVNKIANILRKHVPNLTFLVLNIVFVSLAASDRSFESARYQEKMIKRLTKVVKEVVKPTGVNISLLYRLHGENASFAFGEEMRLKSLLLLLKLDLQIILFNLEVDYEALHLTDLWREIGLEFKNEGRAIKTLVHFRIPGEMNDISTPLRFLKRFSHPDCQLTFNASTTATTIFPGLRECTICLSQEKAQQHAYFPQSAHLYIYGNLGDMDRALSQILQREQLKELFIIVTANSINLGREAAYRLVSLEVGRICRKTPRLYRVVVNGREIEELNVQGREVYKKYLEENQGQYLVYLVSHRRKGKYNKCKVMVMGDGEAGKSTTIRSLAGEPFLANHIQTVVAVKADVLDFEADTWRKVHDGLSRVSTFARDLKFVSAAVVQDEVEGKFETNDEAEVQERFIPGVNAADVILSAVQEANRNVLEVNPHTGDKWIPSETLKNIRNNLKLSVWDFGGQRIFDALHTLYLSDRAIYFIVFNLKKFSEDIAAGGQRMRKWFISVSLFAPNSKILIVGTRASEVNAADMLSINKEVERVLSQIFGLFVHNNGRFWFFPVENSDAESNQNYLQALKQAVKQILEDPKKESIWNQKVELSWMLFMHRLFLRDDKVLSLDTIMEEGKVSGFSEQDVRNMLNFFHSAGSILNFSSLMEEYEDPSGRLSVVLKPDWFLEKLGDLIMARSVSDVRGLIKHKKNILRHFAAYLKKSGVFESSLLESILLDDKTSKEMVDFIIVVCEHRLIMARLGNIPMTSALAENALKVESQESSKFWLVPSFFASEKKPLEQNQTLAIRKSGFSSGNGSGSGSSGVSADLMAEEIRWAENVPPCLYENFICSIVKAGMGRQDFITQKLEPSELSAELKGVFFKISYELVSMYQLKYQIAQESEKDEVCDLVRDAYREVCSVLSYDIAKECNFYTKVV